MWFLYVFVGKVSMSMTTSRVMHKCVKKMHEHVKKKGTGTLASFNLATACLAAPEDLRHGGVMPKTVSLSICVSPYLNLNQTLTAEGGATGNILTGRKLFYRGNQTRPNTSHIGTKFKNNTSST